MVHFVLRHETEPRARFVSSWSEEGRSLAATHGFQPADLDKTYLVIVDDAPLTKSDAGLAVLQVLRPPWRWLRVLRFVPRALRDPVYDLFARNRYRWFGRHPQCFVPPPEQAHRFVAGPARSESRPNHR
jgi:predicted DCC family thiol-disulfide oxidoreductase YuxK